MDMAAVHGDVVERPDVVMYSERYASDHKGSHEEAERREEQPFAPGLFEPFFVDGMQAAPRKKQDQ